VEILAALLADDGPARDDVLVPALEAVALAAIPSFPFDAVVPAAAAESRIHGVPGAADVAFAAHIAPVRDGLGEERAGEARAIGRQLDAHAARRRAASLLEVLRVTA